MSVHICNYDVPHSIRCTPPLFRVCNIDMLLVIHTSLKSSHDHSFSLFRSSSRGLRVSKLLHSVSLVTIFGQGSWPDLAYQTERRDFSSMVRREAHFVFPHWMWTGEHAAPLLLGADSSGTSLMMVWSVEGTDLDREIWREAGPRDIIVSLNHQYWGAHLLLVMLDDKCFHFYK